MGKAERIKVNCCMNDLALGKNIRCFAEDGCLAGSDRARNDQHGFRKLFELPML
jgi:hypothetical protein